MQTGVSPKCAKALLGRSFEEKLRKLDIVWIGHSFGADSQALSARSCEALKRFPGRRCCATLVASDCRLRRACPPREGTLGESGGKTQLAHERGG
jgi:hypothetical protein